MANLHYYSGLKAKLKATGLPVEEVDVDVADFEEWSGKFPEIERNYQNMNEASIEKRLEHYLAYKHLGISGRDIYIDIAAAGSVWANSLNRAGTKAYRLDLSYPKGIKGINIGADAGDTGLPDSFASVLSAQCAYECFMGDADVRFLKEASRILKEKGCYGIVPLYIDETYYVATSPFCNQKDVIIEPEAKKVWRDDGNKEPFSRHYSPVSLKSRVFANIPETMKGKVLFFRNLGDVMKHYPGQKIYCFFMLYCEKK